MLKKQQYSVLFLILIFGLILLFIMDISFGAIHIPAKEVWKSISGSHASKNTWEYIIFNYRFPKAIVAILAGISLSISGLLMQTLFRNPLAGPYVLGLSSGASLGVAFVVLGASILPDFIYPFLTSSYIVVIAATIGSAFVFILVLIISQKIKDISSILIIGLMFGSFTSSFLNILISMSSPEKLQKFTFWTMGSLGNLPWESVFIFLICTLLGLFLSIFCIKPLNALMLGERYAKTIGLNTKRTRNLILISTCILAGSTTAFVGPIAFIGLAVPHISKLIFRTSNHLILFWGTIFFGASTMLLCDIISQVATSILLPINAITSILLAPVGIWLLLKKNKLQ